MNWTRGGLLGSLDQYAPVFGNGKLAVESRWLGTGFDVDGHIKLALCLTAEDAVSGRHIRVIAADGGADVAMMSDEVVGGVEAHPAELRQQHIHPGMSCIGSGAVVVFAAAVEVAGYIARGNAHVAKEGDHGVSKILADAFAADDGLIDGGVDAGGAGYVFEVIEEPLIELEGKDRGSSRRVMPNWRANRVTAGVSTAKVEGRSISQ